MPQFKISHSGLSLNIIAYTGRDRPRQKIGVPALEHSASKAPYTDGVIGDPLHQWQIDALIIPDERTTLQEIYASHVAAKTPATLDDYSELFYEVAPRTRKLAAGASEETINDVVRFFAQFAVWFVGDPVYTPNGGYDVVRLEFLEYQKLAP